MNCAVCGTPRSENEDSCLFCGAKFPEVNRNQEDENYTENDVVSFGDEKEDVEYDIEDFLQNDIDLDKVLSDIEDISLDFSDTDFDTEVFSETVEDETFDFSIEDLSDIEKMLDKETFAFEDLDTVEEEPLTENGSKIEEASTEEFEPMEKAELNSKDSEISEVEVLTTEEIDLLAKEFFEDIDLIQEETLDETDLVGDEDEDLSAEEIDLIAKELLENLKLIEEEIETETDIEVIEEEPVAENVIEVIEEEPVIEEVIEEVFTTEETPEITEDDLTDADLDWISEDDLTEEDLGLIAEEILAEEELFLAKDLGLFEVEPTTESATELVEEEPITENVTEVVEEEPVTENVTEVVEEEPVIEDVIEEAFTTEETPEITEDDLTEEDLDWISEDDLTEEDLGLIAEEILAGEIGVTQDINHEEDQELTSEEDLFAKIELFEENPTVEPTDVELFSEDELEVLNDKAEVVSTEKSPTEIKKSKKDIDFEFSLEDLEDIEKNLSSDSKSTSKTLSMLEQALLSGIDVSEIDVKSSLVDEEHHNIQEVENLTKSKFVNKDNVRAIVKTEELISPEMHEKICNALAAKEKGEILDYVLPSIDKRDDDEILREVQARVQIMMNSLKSTSQEVNEDLFELEKMLIAHEKEKTRVIGVIEDVEDINDSDIDFVDVEDVDDEDNLLKLTADDHVQNNIDNLVKNFRENKEKNLEEDQDAEEIVAPTLEDVEELDPEELGDLELIDREILKAKEIKEDVEAREKQMTEIDTTLDELESLISAVIGDLPDLETHAKAKKLAEEAPPEPEPVAPPKVEKTLYDKELVREYEALRLDLELFFPGTQDLDHLDRDIEELLHEDELGELIEQLDSEAGIDFEGFDFEELTDRDISDALLEMRDMHDHVDRKRLEERRKKRAARIRKIQSVITLGNRVKAYDTALLLVCLFTAISLGVAWISTVNTQNLSVNMQTKNEQLEVADQLWEGLYDIATKYDNIQVSLEGYTKGEIDTNKVTFELSNLIDETIMTRQAFERVDLPTYSEYKFRIDEFLSKRMLLASEALKDIEEGKTESEAISEFLNVETDFSTFDDVKTKFYKQLNLIN